MSRWYLWYSEILAPGQMTLESQGFYQKCPVKTPMAGLFGVPTRSALSNRRVPSSQDVAAQAISVACSEVAVLGTLTATFEANRIGRTPASFLYRAQYNTLEHASGK